MAGIRSIGWWIPSARRTADEVARDYKLSEQSIHDLGLITLTSAGPDDHPSTMGARATRAALDAAGLEVSDIDLLIFTGSTRDWPSPWVVAYGILHKLGSTHAAGFDLSNRCTGGIDGLSVAAALINNGTHQRVAVCSADRFDHVLGPDCDHRLATDAVCAPGAVTAIVSADAENQIVATSCKSNPDLSVPNNLKNGISGGTLRPLSEEDVKNNLHLWKRDISMENILSVKQYDLDCHQHNISRVCAQAGFEKIDFIALCTDNLPAQYPLLEHLRINPGNTLYTFPYLGHIGSVDTILNLGSAVARNWPLGANLVCHSSNATSSSAIAISAPDSGHGISVQGEGFDPMTECALLS